MSNLIINPYTFAAPTPAPETEPGIAGTPGGLFGPENRAPAIGWVARTIDPITIHGVRAYVNHSEGEEVILYAEADGAELGRTFLPTTPNQWAEGLLPAPVPLAANAAVRIIFSSHAATRSAYRCLPGNYTLAPGLSYVAGYTQYPSNRNTLGQLIGLSDILFTR